MNATTKKYNTRKANLIKEKREFNPIIKKVNLLQFELNKNLILNKVEIKKAPTKKELELTKIKEELLSLKVEKKEVAKLAKLIEKAPTKKEIKATQKNEYIAEVYKLDFNLSSDTMNLINRNIDISEQLKQLRKEQLNNSKYIFLNVNSELSALKIAIDADKNLKHIEFDKKGIINLLRLKLNNTKLPKELLNSINISLDYMKYNLSINLEFVTIAEIKKIVLAYEKMFNSILEYSAITKNRIAKAKNADAIKSLLNDIKNADNQYKINQEKIKKENLRLEIIAELEAEKSKKVA